MNTAQARQLMRNYRTAYPHIAEFWMSVINADELNTRHSEYLRAVRQATSMYRGDVEGALAYIKGAQIQYAAWFKERGVTLIFPDADDIPEADEEWFKRAKRRDPPYFVKPWQNFDGTESYGPSVAGYLRHLGESVMRQFGRPEAVRLIKLFGDADRLAEMKSKRYEILSRALRYKLTGTDPGPADLWPSESENPGIFSTEINPT